MAAGGDDFDRAHAVSDAQGRGNVAVLAGAYRPAAAIAIAVLARADFSGAQDMDTAKGDVGAADHAMMRRSVGTSVP